MYRWLRHAHLSAGLFCAPFLLMYALSAVQMAHPSWFSRKPGITEARFSISSKDGRDVAKELMDRHGLRGELAEVRRVSDGWRLQIARPGTVYEIETNGGDALVRTHRAGFFGLINRIHHVAGVTHGYWLINLWGVLVAVVSLGLFIVGGTGMYLWFNLWRERSVGLTLLVLGLGFSVPLLILLRYP